MRGCTHTHAHKHTRARARRVAFIHMHTRCHSNSSAHERTCSLSHLQSFPSAKYNFIHLLAPLALALKPQSSSQPCLAYSLTHFHSMKLTPQTFSDIEFDSHFIHRRDDFGFDGNNGIISPTPLSISKCTVDFLFYFSYRCCRCRRSCEARSC